MRPILTEQDIDKQGLRRKWRRMPGDPLAERERLIKLWTQWAETNKAYLPHTGCWCFTFYYMNPQWRKLVMPRVRALLYDRDREHKERCAREMREYSARCRLKKEQQQAAKAAREGAGRGAATAAVCGSRGVT